MRGGGGERGGEGEEGVEGKEVRGRIPCLSTNLLYCGSTDSSFQAESNDTLHDGHFKIFGSGLAPSSATCVK